MGWGFKYVVFVNLLLMNGEKEFNILILDIHNHCRCLIFLNFIKTW